MRNLAWVAVAVALASGCSVARRGERAAEWRPLFNGRDLAGWTVKCKPADAAGRPFFTVDDGTILADSMGRKGHDYIWLVTDEEYGDFDLRLMFQAYRDSPGNSGVQIRSRYDDAAGWLDGPQIDINPPGAWRTGMIWDETRGSQRWLYPDVPRGQWVKDSMAPAGLRFIYSDEGSGWNALEISAAGPRIRARLNGVMVTDYDGAKVLDDDIHREHQVGLRGHIALQIHTGDELRIRFKDIHVRQLSR